MAYPEEATDDYDKIMIRTVGVVLKNGKQGISGRVEHFGANL